MTQREFFEQVIAYVDGTCEIEDCEIKNKAIELIASLDKKNAKRTSADSKEKKETSARRMAVNAYLANHVKQWFNREEIAEALAITPNQVTSACTALVKSGLVQKNEVKVGKSRKTVYTATEENFGDDIEDSAEES